MAHHRAVAQPATPTPRRIGVLLVNLGTPDSPSYWAVQRFLREFLADRRVIDSSRLLWLPILYGFILPLRPIRIVRKYRGIWMDEGSPLAVLSSRLAAKVAALLHDRHGDEVRVALALTYGQPDIRGAVAGLCEQGARRLLVLPLYPQYCSSTTGSVFDRVSGVLRGRRWVPETRFVNGYHDDAGYIDALAAGVRAHWAQAGERPHLLFSYHGIPARYVERGDPYQAQAQATTWMVVSRLGLAEGEYSHCYQSRFGRLAWLQPYTVDVVRGLARQGVRRLSIVSPSFAVDCLETLEECAIEYRDEFLRLGGESLALVPALNDADRHAEALAGVVRRHLMGWLPAES